MGRGGDTARALQCNQLPTATGPWKEKASSWCTAWGKWMRWRSEERRTKGHTVIYWFRDSNTRLFRDCSDYSEIVLIKTMGFVGRCYLVPVEWSNTPQPRSSFFHTLSRLTVHSRCLCAQFTVYTRDTRKKRAAARYCRT